MIVETLNFVLKALILSYFILWEHAYNLISVTKSTAALWGALRSIKVVAMTVLLQKEWRDKLCFFRAPTILPLAGSLSEEGKRPSLHFGSSIPLYLVSVNRVHRPWDSVQGELGLPDGNNWLDANQLSSWHNKQFKAGQQGWPTWLSM